MITQYLNQKIDISEEDNGWIASWCYGSGVIQIGFFLTHQEAEEAIINLIKRDSAVNLLIDFINNSRKISLICDDEFQAIQNSLMEYVFNESEEY